MNNILIRYSQNINLFTKFLISLLQNLMSLLILTFKNYLQSHLQSTITIIIKLYDKKRFLSYFLLKMTSYDFLLTLLNRYV